jgi:ferredoxin
MMRVSVDASACMGHGRCYDVAPELFDDDEEGYSVVKRDGLVLPREADAARLAVRLCPERAVKLTSGP